MIDVSRYPCEAIFVVKKRKVTRSGVPFLDWSIKAHPNRDRQKLAGVGIYGLFFDKRLIYVGSYLGKDGYLYIGDVIKDRWWTHIATVTMRGHRVSVAKTNLRLLGQQKRLPKRFRSLLDGAPSIAVGNGCSAGLNRILFALKFWREFGGAQLAFETLLPRFQFSYVRYAPDRPITTQSSIQTIYSKVLRIEDGLIDDYKPTCNDKTKLGPPWPTVSISAFERRVHGLMSEAEAQRFRP